MVQQLHPEMSDSCACWWPVDGNSWRCKSLMTVYKRLVQGSINETCVARLFGLMADRRNLPSKRYIVGAILWLSDAKLLKSSCPANPSSIGAGFKMFRPRAIKRATIGCFTEIFYSTVRRCDLLVSFQDALCQIQIQRIGWRGFHGLDRLPNHICRTEPDGLLSDSPRTVRGQSANRRFWTSPKSSSCPQTGPLHLNRTCINRYSTVLFCWRARARFSARQI